MGALDNLKVVDLSRLLPGPFCTTLLADHGADVIVVEAPRFKHDPVLGHVPMVRRNKRHMSLDLKDESGRAVFYELVKRADVLVEGFRPGVADRLGAGYKKLSEINPGLIYCSLTGYGQTGPLADKAGHDMNYMAYAGMLDLVRDQSGNPITPNFQMADVAGSLYAALGILMALYSRAVTGKGQYIDAAMTDGLLSLLVLPLTFSFKESNLPGRMNDPGKWFPCYRTYRTKDGEFMSVGPLEPHLWAHFCNKMGCPEYANFQYDDSKRDEISARLENLFLERNLSEWTEFLNEPDDCVSPVVRVADLINVEHFIKREMIRTPPGGVPEPGIAPKMTATPGSYKLPSYEFGEHTKEILGELGYSAEAIRDMVQKGIAWSRI